MSEFTLAVSWRGRRRHGTVTANEMDSARKPSHEPVKDGIMKPEGPLQLRIDFDIGIFKIPSDLEFDSLWEPRLPAVQCERSPLPTSPRTWTALYKQLRGGRVRGRRQLEKETLAI